MGGGIAKFGKLAAKYKYLLIVVVVGMVLLLWPTAQPETKVETHPPSPDIFSVEEMETRLEAALGNVDGVGRVQVLLTLKTSMETIYRANEDKTVRQDYKDGQLASYVSENSAQTVIVSGSPGEPLVVKHIYPEYQGILVVCDGARDPAVALKVIDAVSSLIGVGSDKITIVPMKE